MSEQCQGVGGEGTAHSCLLRGRKSDVMWISGVDLNPGQFSEINRLKCDIGLLSSCGDLEFPSMIPAGSKGQRR